MIAWHDHDHVQSGNLRSVQRARRRSRRGETSAVRSCGAAGFAQRGPGRGRGSGGWGAGAEYARLYNPKTVETLEGEVVSVDDYTPRNVTGRGMHVTLKTDKESVAVHLGPAWFIERQDVQIDAKDKIKVTGSRITFEDKPAIIAAEIEKGDEVLELRDKQGIPRWAGWRRR